MAQTKTEFALARIVELIDKVVERESINKEGESYADLGWVKFYAKELTGKCDGCQDEAPTGSQIENKD